MKKIHFIFIALLICFAFPQVIKAQGLTATYGMDKKNNIKISNNYRTIYVDGVIRGLQINGKKVDGEVVIGKDKNGDIWIANMSEYRLDVNYEWVIYARYNNTIILDPWEISRLKDRKGELVPNKDSNFGMPWIRRH